MMLFTGAELYNSFVFFLPFDIIQIVNEYSVESNEIQVTKSDIIIMHTKLQ